MKRTTSFHLESDILQEIELYQKKYRLSSKNIALERMLLERRNLLKVTNNLAVDKSSLKDTESIDNLDYYED